MIFRLVPKSMTVNNLERRNRLLLCIISTTLLNLRSDS